jgi:hypothetical protein
LTILLLVEYSKSRPMDSTCICLISLRAANKAIFADKMRFAKMCKIYSCSNSHLSWERGWLQNLLHARFFVRSAAVIDFSPAPRNKNFSSFDSRYSSSTSELPDVPVFNSATFFYRIFANVLTEKRQLFLAMYQVIISITLLSCIVCAVHPAACLFVFVNFSNCAAAAAAAAHVMRSSFVVGCSSKGAH